MEMNQGQGKALSEDLFRILKMMLNAYLHHTRPVTNGLRPGKLHILA
jgi:hypothetical protein